MAKKGLLKKSNIIFSILLIMLILLSFNLISYLYSKESNNMNYVVLDESNNSVSITNILPLTDESGRQIDSSKNDMVVYKEVVLSNKNNKTSKYRLLLDVDSNSNIDPKFIKILVSDKDDNVLKKYDYTEVLTLNKLDNKNNSYILLSSKLKKGESTSYIIRLWVSTFYTINKENENFYGNISIYSY